MRRIIHYLTLAAVLVGLPLGCAWIGGYDEVLADVFEIAPQCEKWVNDPVRLWRVKCPFNWWIFAAMGVVVVAAVWPFARRFIKTCFHCSPTPSTFTFPWWGWVGVAVMAVGWVIGWNRFECCRAIQRYPYVAQWAGFIVLVNALCVKRAGWSPLTGRTKSYLLLFPASSLFWWFFDLRLLRLSAGLCGRHGITTRWRSGFTTCRGPSGSRSGKCRLWVLAAICRSAWSARSLPIGSRQGLSSRIFAIRATI